MSAGNTPRGTRGHAHEVGRGRSQSVSLSPSPVLGLRLPMWRSQLVVFLLFSAFAALAARAMWVQGPGSDFYEEEGNKRIRRTVELPATRGKIFDRNGLVLATSLPVKAVWIAPEDAAAVTPKTRWREVAKLLDISEGDVLKKVNEEKTFVYLKRQVPLDVAQKIAALKLAGLHQQNEYRRSYPESEAMAHVVGFTDIEDRGQEGMELAREAELAGKPGRRMVVKDRLGRVIEDRGMLAEPQQGRDLTLSIDSKIQYMAFNALRGAVIEHKAKAGGVVVLDVVTGELLALANWPTYNPNNRAGLSGEQLRNRVITDTFEPGSTMKPISIAMALDKGIVKSSTQINTAPGRLTIGPNTIRDSHEHGVLSVAEIVQKSSNVGTAKVALQMKPQEMWEMFQSVGFGQVPKIGFPGAVAGRVRPYKGWRPIEQVTMSYGYGLSVSLLQLARAYTIFARDGQLIPLSITRVDEPVSGPDVISPATARAMRQMLEMAAGPGGTAPKAQTMGYRIGGKTGTARKQVGKSYAEGKYRSFFVGMAPMSNPRIIVAVMIDEPAGVYYGGQVAAPVFSELVGNTLRTLNVPPDSSVRQLVTTDAVVESIQ